MTRSRARAVLLLFLLLNLTACSTWQSIGPVSPSRFIEAEQPDRVRVTGERVVDLELVSPSVEGDQLVGAGDVSVPLADILRLEVRELHILRSIGFGWLVAAVAGLAIQGVACLDSPEDCY